MTNAFPVDTHIFRVTKRLGWAPEKATYEKAHQILGKLIPPERFYPIHINLIRLGPRDLRGGGASLQDLPADGCVRELSADVWVKRVKYSATLPMVNPE